MCPRKEKLLQRIKKKPYKKAEKTNKWAPKVSTKEYKYMDNILVATSKL